MIKLKKLRERLDYVEPFSQDKVYLDQYQTSVDVAADFIHYIANNYGFEDRNICDLGCGTGILGIGALLCGAE
jgi:putative methylase